MREHGVTPMRPLPRGELLMDVPPVSSVVVPHEVHVANVEPEECEPQPYGHAIVAEMILVHVCSRLTTVSALPVPPNPIYARPTMICDIVAGA
jgi:hypothetical protein